MEDKQLKYLELLFFCIKRKLLFYTNNEPLSKMIFRFEDIEVIINSQEKINTIKLLYLCRKIIHKILYNDSEYIMSERTKVINDKLKTYLVE